MLKKIGGAMLLVGIVGVFGACGGLEGDTMSISECIIQCAICMCVACAGGILHGEF